MKFTRIAFWRQAAALLVLLLIWSSSPSAQRFKWWQAEHVQREMALTKEQATRLEEIFQSMGFFGEAPDHPETVLNDDVGYRELGFMDRLLLRTLYDPRLSAGMTRDRALPLVRQILKEDLARGP